MASNTDVVKKLYYNMSVLCLYFCVCMSVANIGPYIKTSDSSLLWTEVRSLFQRTDPYAAKLLCRHR